MGSLTGGLIFGEPILIVIVSVVGGAAVGVRKSAVDVPMSRLG